MDEIGYLKVKPGSTSTRIEASSPAATWPTRVSPSDHRRRHRLHGRIDAERWLEARGE